MRSRVPGVPVELFVHVTFDWVLPLESRLSEDLVAKDLSWLHEIVARTLVKELSWFEGYRIENFELKVVKRRPARTTSPASRKR